MTHTHTKFTYLQRASFYIFVAPNELLLEKWVVQRHNLFDLEILGLIVVDRVEKQLLHSIVLVDAAGFTIACGQLGHVQYSLRRRLQRHVVAAISIKAQRMHACNQSINQSGWVGGHIRFQAVAALGLLIAYNASVL
jgi:hypothetical protein